MDSTRHRSNGLSIALAFVLVAMTAGMVGCEGGDNGSPPSSGPTLVEASVAEGTLYNGGLVHLSATVEAQAFPEETPIDFYFVPEGSGDGCGNPKNFVLRDWVLVPVGASEPQSRTFFHQVFQSTTIERDPARPNQRKLTRSALVPAALPPGGYRLAAAIQGMEAGCRKDGKTFKVSQPFAADLLHTAPKLLNNSFRLPPAHKTSGRYRPGPAFSVSGEIGNVGLPVSSPIEIGFVLAIGGGTYPLLVEVADAQGEPVNQDRYVHEPRGAMPGSPSIDQDDVRGGTAHLFLTDQAVAALQGLTADTPGTLAIAIDPDGKIPEMDRTNNTVVLPVQFLANPPTMKESAGNRGNVRYQLGDIFNDCASNPDPDNPNLIFCFSPKGPPANDSWSGSWMYAGYQFGGSTSDPGFLGYGNGTIPESAHFHTASWVQVGRSGCDSSGNCDEPLDALLDFWYAFPPKDDGGELVFADFQGHLKILGDTVFDFDENLEIKSEDDFTLYKKEKKWTLFKDTVDCGGIPLHFDAGANGEVGIGGSLNLSSAQDQSFLAQFSIGPYASLGAFGEASVDLVVCEAGVGVDLDLIDLEPSFQPYVQYYAPTSTHAAAIEIGADVPLEIKSGDGDFYGFVKVIHKFKTPIVSWDGYDHTVDLITPIKLFLGPLGEFLMTTDGSSSTQTLPWTVWTNAPGHSYTWNGRISIEAATYQFDMANMGNVQIFPDDGHGGDSHTFTCGCNQTCTQTVTFSKAGNYTIQASTNQSCFTSGIAQMNWAATGASSVGGLSGQTGNPGGTPNQALGTWYYNLAWNNNPPTSTEPALYKTDDGVDIHIPYNQSPQVTTPPTLPIVNTPTQGLWIQVNGEVPIDPNETKNIVFFFQANKPWNSTDTDNVYLALYDPNGSTIRALSKVPIDSNGNAFVPVQLPSSITGNALFTVYYCSPDGKVFGTPPDANLRMVVAPDGNWLLQDTCTDGSGNPHAVASLTNGPSSPSAGTLGGGSVNSRSVCQSSGNHWQSEYVVGAFNFSTAGEYDFFAGALSFDSYSVWIDGTRLTSRVIADANDSTAYPDQQVCQNPAACPVRESQTSANLTSGYHLVEVYSSRATANPPASSAQVARLRWDPVQANQWYLSFYMSDDELNGVVNADPSSGSYAPTQPLLILKANDSKQGGLGLNWTQMPGDCDNWANNQLNCADSFVSLQNGWYFLFDGEYDLADQQLYRFEGGTWDPPGFSPAINFWLDGQQYGPPPLQLYSSSLFFAVLQNSDPGTAAGVNEIRFTWSESSSEAMPVPPPVSLTWSQLKSNTDYAAYFVDQYGRPSFGGEGSFGSGETQSVCVGPGCPEIQGMPDWGGYLLILGSPVGDPNGTYQNAGGTSLIDMTASFNAKPECPVAWDISLCLNSSCENGYFIGSPPNATTLSSATFVPYADSTSSASAQGLMSQAANNMQLAAWLYNSTCMEGQPFQATLSYGQHLFDMTLPKTSFAAGVCPAVSQCTFTGIQAQQTNGTVTVSPGTISNSTCTGPQASCSFDLAVPVGISGTVNVSDGSKTVPITVSCSDTPQMSLPKTSFSYSTEGHSCTFSPVQVNNTCGNVSVDSGSISGSTCNGPQPSCSFELTVPTGSPTIVNVTDGSTKAPISVTCSWIPTV